MKVLRILLLGVILLSSCTKQESPADQKVEEIQERVRPAAKGGTSAAYFVYINNLEEPDTLLSVQASFAGMAQVHESFETEDGMMGMREQKEIIVMPGEELKFRQGGLHVMLMNLQEDLSIGDSVEVILNFSQTGLLTKRLSIQR